MENAVNDITQQAPDVGDDRDQRRTSNEPARFRKRPVEIYAIQFTGTNHAAISAFAPERFEAVDPDDRVDDPDAVATLFGGAHFTWLPVKVGDWVVDCNGVFEVFSNAAFRAEFEAADTPEDFTWGESISTTDAGSTVDIPVNHGGDYIGDMHLPLTEAVVLRNMLDDLVSEAQQRAARHA